MGKLHIIFVIFVMSLSGLNSLQTLEELKNSLAALSIKNFKKLDLSAISQPKKKLAFKSFLPPLTDNNDDNNDSSSDSDDDDTEENSIQPCTCAVFLSKQFKKKRSPPKGSPVLIQEQDKAFICSPLGIKQCQTKCVETIIKHLPNSAKIICATVDRDINKEKAFLFVQNCNTTWHNTNLSAGKEFCCKNNAPTSCPLVV